MEVFFYLFERLDSTINVNKVVGRGKILIKQFYDLTGQ